MEQDLPEFTWWGGSEPPPDNLKTSKQLAELGLKPLLARGAIDTRKYTLLLYDINDPGSVKPKRKSTPKQLAALKKARKIQKYKRAFAEYMEIYNDMKGDFDETEANRVEVVKWAREILKYPGSTLIFDTETTGLNAPEIIDIALVDLSGKCLLNTQVCPKSEIEPGAFRVHGLSKDILATAPSWDAIAPMFYELIQGKKLLSYNWAFDSDALATSNRLANFEAPLIKNWGCLMLKYARWYGEWSDYWGNFKWQPLLGGDHSAYGDCLAALECLKEMAADDLESKQYKHYADPPKPSDFGFDDDVDIPF